MPLDCAVLVPSVGNRAQFIAAVRQGRFYQCDPNTGTIISSAQIYGPTQSPASIEYVQSNDTLYVGVQSELTTVSVRPNPQNIQNDIYPINPTTLAVGAGLSIGTKPGLNNQFVFVPSGPTNLLSIPGTSKLASLVYAGNFLFDFWIDVVNLASNANIGSGSACITRGMHDWDAVQNLLWIADPNNFRIKSWDLAATVHNFNWPGFTAPYPFGVAVCPDNNQLYISTATQQVTLFDLAAHTFANISLGRPNAKPISIRYNPHNHLIYVPTWTDNTVCLIDPNNANAVTVRTGFDTPIDICITPTKTFAVQQSQVGLLTIP